MLPPTLSILSFTFFKWRLGGFVFLLFPPVLLPLCLLRCSPIMLYPPRPNVNSQHTKKSSRRKRDHLGSSFSYHVLPAAVCVRRSSDLALTALFGFALDFDLWGGDTRAAEIVLQCVVDRYCAPCPRHQSDGGAASEEDGAGGHDEGSSGYGWLLRGQMSARHLLDSIRLRFDEGVVVGVEGAAATTWTMACRLSSGAARDRSKARSRTATLLGRVLYTMLRSSLSSSSHRTSSASLSEADVNACVSALCSLPPLPPSPMSTSVGGEMDRSLDGLATAVSASPYASSPDPSWGVAARASLMALTDLLLHCRAVRPPFFYHSSAVDGSSDVGDIDGGNAALSRNRSRAELIGRLARNLLVSQFHDVAAPVLLSRTVLRGGAGSSGGGFVGDADNKDNGSDDPTDDDLNDWRSDWRSSLLLFSWLTSIAGPEGESAARGAGALLLEGGRAGRLGGCMLVKPSSGSEMGDVDGDDCNVAVRSYVASLVLPPVPPRVLQAKSKAQQVGGEDDCRDEDGKDDGTASEIENYFKDMAHRLRVVLHLLPGLVASLIVRGGSRSKSWHDDCRGNDDEVRER